MEATMKKEVKQNASILAILGNGGSNEEKQPKEPKVKKVRSTYKQDHPRSYERYRGRNGAKAMSYYLPDDIIRLLNIKAASEGVTKSDLVLKGLEYVLRDEIKEEKEKKKAKEIAVND